MQMNDTSVINDAQAVKQPYIHFSKSDAAELLNLAWFDKQENAFEKSNAIPLYKALSNFCRNLTDNPRFWIADEGHEYRVYDAERRKQALFFAAFAWLSRNDVISTDGATGEIRLNPWRVDYAEFDEVQEAIENSNQGYSPCNLSRAQCLLTVEADEMQLTPQAIAQHITDGVQPLPVTAYTAFFGSIGEIAANDDNYEEKADA